MRIENLSEGMVIKNYKELCILLDEPVKVGGNGRQYQLREFERFFTYHKNGHKFIIDAIHTEPLEKIDLRREGNSIYSDDIQNLILCMLNDNEKKKYTEKGIMTLSCCNLLLKLSMININYSLGRKNMKELSDLINIEEFYIYDFFNITHSGLKGKLETALNALNRKALITWKKVMTLCKEEVTIKKNETGTPLLINGEVQYIVEKNYVRATKEEEQLVLNIERKYLEKMHYEDKRDLIVYGSYSEFIKKVNSELSKKANILYYYNSYEIIYNYEDIKNKISSEASKQLSRINLNKNLIEGLIKNSIKRHNESLKIENTLKERDYYRQDIEYIINNKLLADKFININTKQFVKIKK